MLFWDQAEPGCKISPFLNVVIVGAKASIAIAMIGPMPGMDISRAEFSERFASNLSAFSKLAIREESASIWSR
jgi:hypothetical protein